MKPHQIYLRFLELEKKLETENGLPLLDPKEKIILKHISLVNNKNIRLSVKDMMDESDICSPVTMHKNIHSLVDKGWIYLEETEDTRRKQLKLTKQAIKYFNKLGMALQNSTK